jgi:hypothetical protein
MQGLQPFLLPREKKGGKGNIPRNFPKKTKRLQARDSKGFAVFDSGDLGQ